MRPAHGPWPKPSATSGSAPTKPPIWGMKFHVAAHRPRTGASGMPSAIASSITTVPFSAATKAAAATTFDRAVYAA